MLLFIGFIDQSKPLQSGGMIEQAEGIVWMAFFCSVMLEISLELAYVQHTNSQAYEDMASKFLNHFVSLHGFINGTGGKDSGLWNEENGFYYDRIRLARLTRDSCGYEYLPSYKGTSLPLL